MTLQDFVLTDNNHFIASQNRNLFFKRVFLVLITKNYLVGLVCNNRLTVETNADLIINNKNNLLSTQRGSLNNPYSYLKAKMVKKIVNTNLYDKIILGINKANFRIDRNDVKVAINNATRAKYLAKFPSDGTVYIETIKGIKHEFHLLGDQNGNNVVQWILKRHEDASLN